MGTVSYALMELNWGHKTTHNDNLLLCFRNSLYEVQRMKIIQSTPARRSIIARSTRIRGHIAKDAGSTNVYGSVWSFQVSKKQAKSASFGRGKPGFEGHFVFSPWTPASSYNIKTHWLSIMLTEA